jgi:hypothetical protein
MSRLGRRIANQPQLFATPLVIVDPQTVGISAASADVTASVTASDVYPRTFVYVYRNKDESYRIRRGPIVTVTYGVEPGDVDPANLSIQSQVIAYGVVTADTTIDVTGPAVAVAVVTAVSVAAPVFYFTTPTIRERRYLRRHRLWDRMYLDRGLSILRFGASYQQIDNPSTDEMESADALFIGGRTYLIDEDEADLLIGAGYGHWVNNNPEDPIEEIDFSQYGAGAYGAGPYGV